MPFDPVNDNGNPDDLKNEKWNDFCSPVKQLNRCRRVVFLIDCIFLNLFFLLSLACYVTVNKMTKNGKVGIYCSL